MTGCPLEAAASENMPMPAPMSTSAYSDMHVSRYATWALLSDILGSTYSCLQLRYSALLSLVYGICTNWKLDSASGDPLSDAKLLWCHDLRR